MKINRDVVAHVAKLAHLKLDPGEMTYYEEQLSRVLAYIGQLAELKDVDVKSNLTGDVYVSTSERSDTVILSGILEAAMEQAPNHIGTAFQVPRIID